MSQNLIKSKPVRLNEGEYLELREQVFQRDSWRCQFCGLMINLEVHHQRFRSHSGPDLSQALSVSTIALVFMLLFDRARSRIKKALDRTETRIRQLTDQALEALAGSRVEQEARQVLTELARAATERTR